METLAYRGEKMKSTSKVVFCGIAVTAVTLITCWSLDTKAGLALAGVAILSPCQTVYEAIKKSPKYGSKDFLPKVAKELSVLLAIWTFLLLLMWGMSAIFNGRDSPFTEEIVLMAVVALASTALTSIAILTTGYRQWSGDPNSEDAGS